ncbi:hypothetical protein MKW94_019408 [Papaver nudicaule]|uniref:Helicase-like transcription factor CHR28 n=1 Tax=Papaver nudicaule TaxID=74823 RepID=A0AA41VHC4_PAPNU|nr:hypothetical protein [Papaver nudicaule]
MLKTDDNYGLWSGDLSFEADWDDKYSIDLDSLNAILSEDSNPLSQSSPDDLSSKSFIQAELTSDDIHKERVPDHQNGSQECGEAQQVGQESTSWYPPAYLDPSYCNSGMESDCFTGSPGYFNDMVYDQCKLEAPSNINSPVDSCSVSLRDWFSSSHPEHGIWSGEMSIDSERIPNCIANCNTPLNFSQGEGNQIPNCSDGMNFMHVKSEIALENEFQNPGGDPHLRCPSQFMMMESEKSAIPHGTLSAASGSSMEDLGSLERNPSTSSMEFQFLDKLQQLPSAPYSEISDCRVSHFKTHNNCSTAAFCGVSSAVADSECVTSHSTSHIPVKRENLMYGKDGVVDDVLVYPNGSTKSETTSGAANASSQIVARDCTGGRDSSYNASAAPSISLSLTQPLPFCKKEITSREGIKKLEHVADAIGKRAKYCPSPVSVTSTRHDGNGPSSNNASRKLLAGFHSLASSKREIICIEDEKEHKLLPPSSLVSHSVKVADEKEHKLHPPSSLVSHSVKVARAAVHGNNSHKSTYVEDDVDICILEDISDPRTPASVAVHGKSLVTAQYSGFNDSINPEMGVTRTKADDERLIFRVALQDLSQPKTEASPPDGVLAVPLLRHQRIALSWMVQKETASLHCSGGILADDQGLGKTISTIALILKERSPSSKVTSMVVKEEESEALNLDGDDGVLDLDEMKEDRFTVNENKNLRKCENAFVLRKGRPAAGTLVVCPTSVLRQWADELQTKVTEEANLSFLIYHGTNRTRDPFELAKYDVVLTTYSIVSMEVPKQPLVDKDDEEKGKRQAGDSSLVGLSSNRKRKYPPSSGKNNMDVDVDARPLARVGWFRVVLDEAQSIKNHRTQVARACWGLRAKRRWCLSGTPIQNAIDDLYSYFRFLRYDPYAGYKSFVSTIKVPIQRNSVHGYKKLQAVLKTIMLRRTKATVIDGEPIITLPPKTIELKKVDFSMEERDFYSQLEADSRAQFKVYAAAGTVKQNYVNILLMLLRLRQACDHPLLVKGYNSNSVWKSSLAVAKALPKEKQMDLLNSLEGSLAICSICKDPPEDAVVTICGHVFCNQCICEHLTGDDTQCPSTQCKVQLSVTSIFSRGTLRSSVSNEPGHDSSIDKSDLQLVEKLEPCSEGISESSKIKAAMEVLQSLSKPRTCAIKMSSSKISETNISDSHCMETASDTIGKKLVASVEKSSDCLINRVPEKAIVFSQWTRMLDLLEARLKSSSIQYRRLDGTMSVLARDKAVRDFKTLPEVTVIIMSLKAASLGLNMVAACHVLLLDLWWNPTTEDQAIDRAHRIGQTRPVSVLRLTVKDTVEDRILALQEKKRIMVASAFGEDGAGGQQTRLTVDDLKYLFMG